MKRIAILLASLAVLSACGSDSTDDAGTPPVDTGITLDVPVTPDVGVDVAPPDTVSPPDVAPDTAPDTGPSVCHSDRDCSSLGLVCERTSGRCVECNTMADCTGDGRICSANRCVAVTHCTTSRMCPGQVCNTMLGYCVDCNTMDDCTGGQVCRGNRCVPPPRTCHSSRECGELSQVCDTMHNICVDCVVDADCAAGQFCGTDTTCHAQVCMPNAATCTDGTHVRTCNARGSAYTDTLCGTSQVCSMGTCRMRVCMPGTADCDTSGARRVCNADGLGYTTAMCPSGMICFGGMCVDRSTCIDTDGDGLSDMVEGAPSTDTDGDMTPDFRDLDSDNDGFSDHVEATRTYPGFESHMVGLVCGGTGDNCDAPPDGLANFRDLDSDNDGLTDHEEFVRHTDSCNADTDGDGATDLIEVAAGSDPTSTTSRPPTSTLYVILPYHPPAMTGAHVHREFTFQTTIRSADVVFLVDTTGSMGSTISALRSSLTSTIVPGIMSAFGGSTADVRYAAGDFRSFPISPDGDSSDYVFWMRQPLTRNASLVNTAINAMSASGGGDAPETSTDAIYQTITGDGEPGHLTDPTPHYGLTMGGAGFAGQMSVARDCASDSTAFGWACFQPGRVPIIVLFSDADWINNSSGSCGGTSCSTYPSATFSSTVSALMRRGAYFVGVDVGTTGETYSNSQIMARMTGTVDRSGTPIAFMGSPSSIASNVVTAVTTITGQTRQDITTRTVPDATEHRLPTSRTTADFVKAVTPARGIPDMPTGYDRRDMTTFYNVAPSTQVVFDVDFYNDFQPGGMTAQLFTATINVIGRAGSVVDTRPVYVVVPAQGSGM